MVSGRSDQSPSTGVIFQKSTVIYDRTQNYKSSTFENSFTSPDIETRVKAFETLIWCLRISLLRHPKFHLVGYLHFDW